MSFVDTDVGAELVYAGGQIFKAQPGSATYVWGPWVDVKQNPSPFQSMIAVATLGTSSGAPTSQQLLLAVQDAADTSGTGAAAYLFDGVNAAGSKTGITGLKAATDGALTQLNVRLPNARRAVRVGFQLTFTAGASPANDVHVALVLGGPRDCPTTPPNP